jgi:hypothetical protein
MTVTEVDPLDGMLRCLLAIVEDRLIVADLTSAEVIRLVTLREAVQAALAS